LSAIRVRRSLCLVAAVLVLAVTLLLQPVGLANAQGPGDYIVTELGVDILSAVTPSGVRTVIYTFAAGTQPTGVAIDHGGNYIVAESTVPVLSRITPGGVRTVIYTFAVGTFPFAVAIPPILESPVGGVVTLTNEAVILTPYLALVGLLLAASVLLVLGGRHKS
jgi:streptogramin lyase